jgi:hypothetical protein
MILLLAEWGSHGIIYANATSSEGQAISASEDEHEDPCKTLVRCSDGRRQDQVPNFAHDGSQHNAIFNGLSSSGRRNGVNDDPRCTRDITGLSRPISPPFHPPELS